MIDKSVKNIVISLLFALNAPLLLIPVEKILPYPFIVEELAKMLSVILLIRSTRLSQKHASKWVLAAGFLFTLSETMLYQLNYSLAGNRSLFFSRLICTGLLHTGTMLVMYVFGRKSWWGLLPGFAAAAAVHYFYNNLLLGAPQMMLGTYF